jgi:hypothetical protein
MGSPAHQVMEPWENLPSGKALDRATPLRELRMFPGVVDS